MKRLLFSSLVGLTLLPCAGAAADAFYINKANLTVAPQVDATNFVNQGSIGFPSLALAGVQLPNYQLGVYPIITTLPFETSDTLNFTNQAGTFANSGVMVASPGWIFRNNPPTTTTSNSMPAMAGTFFENNGAVVAAIDFYPSSLFPCSVAPVNPSILLISATNIIIKAGTPGSSLPATKASLIVGPNGSLNLEGHNVQLTRSGLEVLPVWDEAVGSTTTSPPTNFIPDVAIYDQYWVQAAFGAPPNNLASETLWNGSIATAPGVASPPLAGPLNNPAPIAVGAAGFTLPFPFDDSYIFVPARSTLNVILTNFIGSVTNVTGTNLMTNTLATNVFKGAVFVSVAPGFNAPQLGFTTVAGANFSTIGVLLSVPITNTVTTSVEPAYIFFQDTLASRGAQGLSVNEIGCSNPTDRPGNYLIDRLLTSPGAAGSPNALDCRHVSNDPAFFLDSGAGCIDPINIIFDSVTNTDIRAGNYSAYSPFLDNVVSRPPPVPGGTVTNLPGRIRIAATNLDLTKTRLRAEGEIVIQTSQLISSSNAVIDCENLSLNVNSANGNLTIQNLAPQSVARLRGPIYTWSAVWNNTDYVIYTNNYIFSNVITGTNMVGTNLVPITNVFAFPSLLTNIVNLGLHTLMMDARFISTVLPVTVLDLTAYSTNVVLNDSMSVAQTLFINGQSFTINGSLIFQGFLPPNPVTGTVPPDAPLTDWNSSVAPNLLYFTNNGTLSNVANADFGDDRPIPYSAFVNAGGISAFDITLSSTYFENSGTLSAVGPMTMQGGSGKLINGNSISGSDTEFDFSNLKFNNFQLAAGGALNFNVTGSLSDAGPGSGNLLQVQNGFNLFIKPPTGDLLGTTLQSTILNVPSEEVDHYWAGQDRGPVPAGYLNNEAVGTVVLSSQSPDPLFFFAGATGNGVTNGLYVDLLDISSLGADYSNRMAIDPSLVIYYAAAKVGFTPPLNQPGGVPQEPEEFLDGQFGGHLRWVQTFAGPNSSFPAVINGQSVLVNRGLRFATTIYSCDSNLPNYLIVNPCSAMLGDPPLGPISTNGIAAGGVPKLNYVVTDSSQPVLSSGFASAAGTYNGLFYDTNGVAQTNSGYFSAKTTGKGNYSAKILLGNKTYSISGKLGPSSGMATNTIVRKGTTSLTVYLQLVQLNLSGAYQILGSVTDGNWLADLIADHQAGSPSLAGKYTLLINGGSDTNGPVGNGFGTVTVDGTGNVQWKGTLADGTKVSQKSGLSGQGIWPLYNSPYGGNGAVLSWIQFDTNQPQTDLSGELVWIKGGGFTNEVLTVGSSYKSRNLNLMNADLIFNGGSLSGPFTNKVALQLKKAGGWAGTNELSLTISTSSGLFSGSALNPETGHALSFQGALFEKADIGAGFFANTNRNGQIYLNSPP